MAFKPLQAFRLEQYTLSFQNRDGDMIAEKVDMGQECQHTDSLRQYDHSPYRMKSSGLIPGAFQGHAALYSRVSV